jgi:hypothetical protein
VQVGIQVAQVRLAPVNQGALGLLHCIYCGGRYMRCVCQPREARRREGREGMGRP